MTEAKRSIRCPACGATLSMSAASTAARIHCVKCDTVFPAALAAPAPQPQTPPAPKPKSQWRGPIIGTIAAALAAGGCAAVLAGFRSSSEFKPPPGATETDVAFLKAVHKEGITNKGGEQIDLGRSMCVELAAGKSINGIAEHWGLTSQRMSADSARFFVRTAAAAYCPQYVP